MAHTSVEEGLRTKIEGGCVFRLEWGRFRREEQRGIKRYVFKGNSLFIV